MDIALIIISSVTLIVIGFFLYLYWTNEKKNKAERANDINELKELLTALQNKIQETSSKQNEKFEALAKNIMKAHDEANSKINNNFELLQTAFKDYSQKVQEALTKYSDENIESKKATNQIKDQIQKELKNILTEIKAPLDLD